MTRQYPHTCYRQHKEYKRKIRERDGNRCQTCGSVLGENGVRQMDVAHVLPFAVSRDSSPTNLRTLCHSCNQRERTIRPKYPTMSDYWRYLEAQLA